MEAMENKVNEVAVETAEEIVMQSSKGCWKKIGIVGGLVALGVAGYFVVKKIRNKQVDNADIDASVDLDDAEFLDEDVAAEEN